MPSGSRNAEWHVKRKSARTKRSNFQVHPAAEQSSVWLLVHGLSFQGYFLSSPRKPSGCGVLLLDLGASEDYIFQDRPFLRERQGPGYARSYAYGNSFGTVSLAFSVSSSRSTQRASSSVVHCRRQNCTFLHPMRSSVYSLRNSDFCGCQSSRNFQGWSLPFRSCKNYTDVEVEGPLKGVHYLSCMN